MVTGCVLLGMLAAVPATANAAFPGQNGKILFVTPGPTQFESLKTINPDGTGVTTVTDYAAPPAGWSPSGTRIAFECGAMICAIDPDGSNFEFWYDNGQSMTALDWSPDGTTLSLVDLPIDFVHTRLFWVGAGPDPPGQSIRRDVRPGNVAWSPDGSRIAFIDGWQIPVGGIQTIAPDGSGLATVPNTAGATSQDNPVDYGVDWSPDAQRLVFGGEQDGVQGLFTIKLDGTSLTRLTNAPSGSSDSEPAWSPDGTRIAFTRSAPGNPGTSQLHIVNPQGGAVTPLSAPGTRVSSPDWQPLPVNAYARPKGASPMEVSLVPAYEQCTSANRTHGPPLAFGSCSSPTQASNQLTVGSPDANGQPAKSVSSMRINPLRGDPSTPADEADVRLRANINDVRLRSDLSDYSGTLEVRLTLQITDRDNTPHPGGPGAATVQSFTHSHPLPCAPTANTTVGSTCAFDTTVEALVPGAVKELTRAIWALGAIRVHDGAGNLFLTQGVFVP